MLALRSRGDVQVRSVFGFSACAMAPLRLPIQLQGEIVYFRRAGLTYTLRLDGDVLALRSHGDVPVWSVFGFSVCAMAPLRLSIQFQSVVTNARLS